MSAAKLKWGNVRAKLLRKKAKRADPTSALAEMKQMHEEAVKETTIQAEDALDVVIEDKKSGRLRVPDVETATSVETENDFLRHKPGMNEDDVDGRCFFTIAGGKLWCKLWHEEREIELADYDLLNLIAVEAHSVYDNRLVIIYYNTTLKKVPFLVSPHASCSVPLPDLPNTS